MTDNDKHKLSDDELDAYMDGSHAVSRAFQDLEKASPPPELDARILARARASVDQKPGIRKDVFIRPYAAAATVFVCLGITFLLINNPEVPTPADLRSSEERFERTIPVTMPQESPQAPAAEENRTSNAVAENLGDNTRQANTAVDTDVGAANDVEPERSANPGNLLDLVQERVINESAEPPATQRQRLNVDNPTASTADQVPVTNASQARREAGVSADAGAANVANFVTEALEEINVTGNSAASTAGNGNAAGAAQVVNQTAESLEEIVVTGSRIEVDTDFRNDRENWLREIARLREAGDTVGTREEEILFLDSYPGTDIDAALAELEIP